MLPKGCFFSRTALFTTGIGWLRWKTTLRNSADESHIFWLLSYNQIIKNLFMDRAMQPEYKPALGTCLYDKHFLKRTRWWTSLVLFGKHATWHWMTKAAHMPGRLLWPIAPAGRATSTCSESFMLLFPFKWHLWKFSHSIFTFYAYHKENSLCLPQRKLNLKMVFLKIKGN